VRTTGGIEAFVGKDQTLDGFAVHDVGFDDLVDIGGGDASVPDAIGIDDDGGSVLALVEASRHIGAHAFFETAQREFLLEEELQLGLARGIAAAARMSGFALIAANEEMLLELGHELNVQDFAAEMTEGGMARAARLSRPTRRWTEF
jgi:hypothetical protein